MTIGSAGRMIREGSAENWGALRTIGELWGRYEESADDNRSRSMRGV